MTMQVGMVGTDGVLIASDTQWTENRTSVRHSLNSTKFVTDDVCGIAISRARSMETAAKIADEIMSLYRQDQNWMSNDLYAVPKLGKKVLNSVEAGREDAQCFVASVSPTPKLHLFQIVKFPNPIGEMSFGMVCREVSTRAFAGDTPNSAVFWGERYYPRLPQVPVKNLIPLAAHIVVTARLLNSAGISGLEIVWCDDSGVHALSNEENLKLEQISLQRDKDIGESLLSDIAY